MAAKLKRDSGLIVTIHCVAHRLELGILDAIKQNNRLKRLQQVLQLMYHHYHYSPKALRELRDLAAALEEKVLKPTNIYGSRWLPYIRRAANVSFMSEVRAFSMFRKKYKQIYDVFSPDSINRIVNVMTKLCLLFV